MISNYESAAEVIKNKKIKMVDLKFCDLWGRWHHVTISEQEFSPTLMKSGVGFDGSSVGLKSVKSGDMALIPDFNTGFIDPFYETPTLSFICNTVEADTKKYFWSDPREILRRAESYLLNSGFADQSIWGPEFEFYIFDSVKIENQINAASYLIESSESLWGLKERSSGNFISVHGGYHAIPPKDQMYELRSKMVDYLQEAGVPVKYHHHEVGSAGQCEIETPLMGSMAAADSAMLIKYIVKMTASLSGKTATFLPKPLFGEAGSGMHYHQQLFQNGKNVFYDSENPNLLSKIAHFYIGGLLYHAPAVLAFTNPTTNSYKRLVPGFEAPINCFYSSGNRSAAIRLPKYATEPQKVRLEFRPPDGMCNPYLAIAAMLLAGIDGIMKQIDPTNAGFGPFDEDIFSWSNEKRDSIKKLPTSLGQAMTALENDHDFLIQGDVFNIDLINDWIKLKRSEELEFFSRPHPFEIQQYFDF